MRFDQRVRRLIVGAIILALIFFLVQNYFQNRQSRSAVPAEGPSGTPYDSYFSGQQQ
jgi:hypothetical protein